MVVSTFIIFVQVCDICPFFRTHSFGADEVAYRFLLTEELAEGTIEIPLPVDLVTVYLIGE